jgi:precorrin-6B methylase 2
MKQLVKKLLYGIAPRWTTAAMSARARAHSHKVIASWGCGPLNRRLIERFGSQVLEGPFAGLTLSPMTHAEQIGPYLLGVYESELDTAWEFVFRKTYTQIIDIGAKFGYYAVGLAKRYPDASVIAFDTDWWARKALQEMADANEVRNVEVLGFCSPEWLSRNLQESSLVICDCEGYEAVLFGSGVTQKLQSATLIIETHDCFVPAVSAQLRAAFEKTHVVQVLGDTNHRRSTSHALDFLDEPERRLAVQEVRPPQLWLLCLPKTGPNQAV